MGTGAMTLILTAGRLFLKWSPHMQPKLSEIYYLAQAGLEALLCQPLDIAVVNHQAQPQGLKSISSYSREPMLDSPVTPALGESIFMYVAQFSYTNTHTPYTYLPFA